MFSIFDGPDAQCVLLSVRPILTDALREVLKQNEASIEIVGDYAELETALETQPDLNYILIDLDGFDGVHAQYDCLTRFRNAYPDKYTILFSSDFQTDEFGTHRLMLGDISLRVPVLHASLELALLQAPVNNLEWRSRRHVRPVRAGAVASLT